MKVLVLGKGVANDGAILLLKEENIEYDYLEPCEVKEFLYDYIVKAPGIPYSNSTIKKLLLNKCRIITDLELAMTLRKKFYICVSGSNGKTTTVSLITHLLKKKYNAIACGNIGYSICKAVVENPNADVFVVEASSFQLENSLIDPNISVLLNINPCHLDHHESYKKYVKAKEKIFINQSSSHYFVYNNNDFQINSLIKGSNAKKVSFSVDSFLSTCYINDNWIYFKNKKILKVPKKYYDRIFYLEDVLASIATVMLVAKISPRSIRKKLLSFEEIEYRLTKVNDYIYNDAKSTNPYSTIAALKCFNEVLLICGGYDRKENLNCLLSYLSRIKKVFTYGQTKDKVYNFMINHNVDCEICDSLDVALKKALEFRINETVLFSPMFASFDSFKNYLERGNYFSNLVIKYLS